MVELGLCGITELVVELGRRGRVLEPECSHRLGGRTSIELDADPNRLRGLPWPWRLGGRGASEVAVEVEEVVARLGRLQRLGGRWPR
mmetsp:Transcript_42054/g.101243  ORF Transcript_42054/g.101243 Transcript_42054/m.101243 type:complete len:87 (-) Transcript_42054:304-564(-)